MKYEARNFSQKSYNTNDKWAKDLFVPFLIQKGYTITSLEEDFLHDLKTLNPSDEEILFELEVKTGYPFRGKKSFPFDSVSFTGRKKRLHEISEFHYVIICKETKWAISAKSSDIYEDAYIENIHIETNVRDGADQFYRVPKNKCKFFKIR